MGRSRSELTNLVSSIRKRHGKEVVTEGNAVPNVTVLPTNIFTLDYALLGGIPESHMTLIYGWESAGKSMLSYRVIASAQKKYPDKKAVLFDIEGTYDANWGEIHGIDNERLLLINPPTGEDAADGIVAALGAEDCCIVVVDSIAALMPTADIEKSLADNTMAERARLVSRMLGKTTRTIVKERKRGNKATLVCINQIRHKVGLVFGDNRTLPGGNAQNFHASLKIYLKNKEKTGKDDNKLGIVDYNEHSFKIDKNKVGTSMRTAEFKMIRNPDHELGAGFIDDAETLLAFAKKADLYGGGGQSWTIDGVDEKFGNKKEARQFLLDNPDQYQALKEKVIGLRRLKNKIPAEPPDDYL